MRRFPQLLVHIGSGKTGSTSIQRMLADNQDMLAQQGVAWLGMMLERCQNTPRFDWQSELTPAALFEGAPTDETCEQLYQVLRHELERLSECPVRYAVWSHEAIFARTHGIGAALKRLQADGVPVRIFCFLRRHDRWAKSAYAQWGIKHKTYSGPVMRFSDWIGQRPVRFAHHLRYWQETFGPALELRNYDEISDVTAEIAEFLGVKGIESTQVYQTPSACTLAAWAIYNSQYQEPVLPARFNRLLNAGGTGSKNLSPTCDQIFPSAEDLARVLRDAQKDLDYINQVLASKGQPTFRSDAPATPMTAPTEWEMIQFLTRTIFALQERVLLLHQRIEQLECPD